MKRCTRLYSTIRWNKWGNEAFNRAKEANTPLLIYSGASSPPVERFLNETLLSDPAVTKTINDSYVPIKLDNSSRSAYQSFLMYTQSKTFGANTPFYLATVDATTNMPTNVSWELNNAQCLQFLSKSAQIPGEPKVRVDTIVSDPQFTKYDVDYTLDQAYLQYKDMSYDQFFRFAMGYALSVIGTKHTDFVAEELSSIARSGIVDHVGGGVFIGAYSRDWHLPEFTKQLGWQAMLLTASTEILKTREDKNIAELGNQIVRGISNHISANKSLLYGSSDTYLWLAQEFSAALKPHFDLISTDILEMYWGINANGNINSELLQLKSNLGGMNVLTPYKSVDEVAKTFGVNSSVVSDLVEKSQVVLAEYRNAKKPAEEAGYEMKLSHYGLALSALAKSIPISVTMASELSGKMVQSLLSKPITGVACDDYAYIIMGLLDYYEHAEQNSAVLELAKKLQAEQIELFEDSTNNGFFYSLDLPHLFSRAKFTNDTMEPNYNAISVKNMERLDVYKKLAENTQRLGTSGSVTHPLSHLSWCENISI